MADVIRRVRWAAEDALYDLYDLMDAIEYKVEHDDRAAMVFGLCFLALVFVAFGLAGASDYADRAAVRP